MQRHFINLRTGMLAASVVFVDLFGCGTHTRSAKNPRRENFELSDSAFQPSDWHSKIGLLPTRRHGLNLDYSIRSSVTSLHLMNRIYAATTFSGRQLTNDARKVFFDSRTHDRIKQLPELMMSYIWLLWRRYQVAAKSTRRNSLCSVTVSQKFGDVGLISWNSYI